MPASLSVGAQALGAVVQFASGKGQDAVLFVADPSALCLGMLFGYNTVEHNPVVASGSCPSGSSSTVGWKRMWMPFL